MDFCLGKYKKNRGEIGVNFIFFSLFFQKTENHHSVSGWWFAFPLKMGRGAIIKSRLFAAGQSSIFSIPDVQ